MSNTIEANGICLCGAVQLTANQISLHMGACHCTMCRKWGGSPLLAVDCGTDVSFNGKENISIFNSSAWAERGFCSKCGTHLFYRLKGNNQYIVPIGIFGDDIKFTFTHQIFVDEKSECYSFENKTENMTGAEVFAKFAPQAT